MNSALPVNPKMSDRPAFADFPETTRKFYSRIMFVMMLNQAAFKKGLFDVDLVESDDIYSWMRFYDAIPDLKHRLGLSVVQ